MTNPSGKKNWLLIGGLVVVLAGAGYVATQGGFSGKDASGSIVPAERYRAETAPVTADKVVLGDEAVAKFMQTDLYERLLKEPELAEALQSDAFRRSIRGGRRGDGHRDVITGDGFRDLVNDDGFRDLINDDGFRDLINDDGFRKSVKRGDGQRDLINDEAFRKSVKRGDGQRDLINDDGFRDLINDDGFRDLINDDGMRDLISDGDAMRDVIGSDADRRKRSEDAGRDSTTDAGRKYKP